MIFNLNKASFVVKVDCTVMTIWFICFLSVERDTVPGEPNTAPLSQVKIERLDNDDSPNFTVMVGTALSFLLILLNTLQH